MKTTMLAAAASCLYFFTPVPVAAWTYTTIEDAIATSQQLLQAQEFEQALDVITQAIEANPSMAGLYFYRSNVRGHANDFQGSIDDLNQALSLDPDYADAYYQRSQAYSRLAEQNPDPIAALKELTPLCISDMEKYVELSGGSECTTPKCARAYHGLAFMYYSNQDLDSSCFYGSKAKSLGFEIPFFGSRLNINRILPIACYEHD